MLETYFRTVLRKQTQRKKTMTYTIAQLEAGLADAKAEYKNAKAVNATYPSVEAFFNVENTYARIKRINTMIAEA